ncbi:MAG: prolyl aminopeptidase [Candidatus Aminicenantaceae bacterium]
MPKPFMAQEAIRLWPAIEPYQTDFLKVSELHEIYYELCGNPKGKPVFVLHGGPGAQSQPYYRRFFDPKKYLIVLSDQRGCGRSRPFAELKGNTTQDLVSDIEKLRCHLNLDKIIIFGGSWGSTLGLAYSETHPQNVSALVLRGIFTSTKAEIQHYYQGVRSFFPEAFDRFQGEFDAPVSPEVVANMVQSEDSSSRARSSQAWTRYELKIAELEVSDAEVNNLLQTPALAKLIYSLALFENHYLANSCFLAENQLLDQADKIAHIPAFLVNGRYDMICPPVTAYRLHEKLPQSKLYIIEGAGHSMSEEGITRALLRIMRELE